MSETQEKDRQRIDAYRKELEQDPQSLVFIALAEALNRLGEWDDAARVARKGLDAHPDSVAGRLSLAVAEAGRDNIRDALEQIKAALIVDQENPRALALMGSLLLQKGLAKRAVQFLSHAAKLSPDSREYADLLRRAKRLAKSESPIQLPVLRGENVPNRDSPWREDADEGAEPTEFARPGADHTVFSPDGGKKTRSNPPPPLTDDAEPTKHAARIGLAPEDEKIEDRTSYDMRNLARSVPAAGGDGPARKKPKLGGSAADYSRMVRAGEIDGAREGGAPEVVTEDAVDAAKLRAPAPDVTDSPTTRLPSGEIPAKPPSKPSAKPASKPSAKPSSAPRAGGGSAGSGPRTSDEKPPTVSQKGDPAKLDPARVDAASTPWTPRAPSPSPKEAASVREDPKIEAAAEKAAPEDRPAKKDKPKKAAVSAPEPEAKPQDARPATMMVDDAIWAIYGGEKPAGGGPTALKIDAPAEKAEAKGKAEAKEEPAASGRPGVMVVRTAGWFGTLTYWALVLVLAGGAAWFASAQASTRSGSRGGSDAVEEVRGVFSDLERGGLASYLAAEEAIEALIPTAPELKPLLVGGLAEARARIWAEFGGNAKMREVALADLASIAGEAPTLEVLAARTVLSTSAATLASIREQLRDHVHRLSSSPKAWLLEGQLAAVEHDQESELRALYTARDLNPRRRHTLLALARWHARHESFGSAFAYFDELQEHYPEDVQAALERYVFGRLSGVDPAENEATSRLAGLVREEVPEVAKDETGRVALAFAVTAFSIEDVETGLAQLARAEAAYDQSAIFKLTIGRAYLAAGDWDRAKPQLERALEIDPAADDARIGLALVEYGRTLDLPRVAASAAPKDREPQAESARIERAELPYGTIRFVPGRFELINVVLDGRELPIASFEAATATARGAELERRLSAKLGLAIAQRKAATGDVPGAIARVEKARATHEDAEVLSELGRLLLLKDDKKAALMHFAAAKRLAGSDPAARVALAESLAAAGETVQAVEILEAVIESGVISPRAHGLMGRLKLARGDYAGARELLTTALEIDPASSSVVRALAEVDHRTGHTAEAAEHYAEALVLDDRLGDPLAEEDDPRGAIDLYYLGRAILEKNERRGIAMLQAALKREGAPVQARFYLGRALLKRPKTARQGRRELELFRKAVPEGDLSAEAERLLKPK
ncbi:MAG: tetratricopeptide repeat protein [Deltaproteobacteria bacterium]|nr:tetratricopeptide repeat protein [Deltaproteobacteria bacterium]